MHEDHAKIIALAGREPSPDAALESQETILCKWKPRCILGTERTEAIIVDYEFLTIQRSLRPAGIGLKSA